MKFTNPHVEDTLRHKRKVAENLLTVSNALMARAFVHDDSKLSDEEMAEYTRAEHERRAGHEVQSLGDAWTHHYENNRHHPEFHENGINDMSIIDIIEMVCDWKAAGERGAERNGEYHTAGDLLDWAHTARERFGISDAQFALIRSIIGTLYGLDD